MKATNEFILTPKTNENAISKQGGLSLLAGNSLYNIYAIQEKLFCKNKVSIFIDGYLIPINSDFGKYENFDKYELVYELYITYGEKFTSFIKGIFCIVIFFEQQIQIFTDHLGIYKLFYSDENKNFVCSNSAKLITKTNKITTFNSSIIAVKCLLNREINGQTIFNNLKYTQPASIITINPESIKFRQHYYYKSLLEKETENFNFQYFADFFNTLVQHNDKYLKPEQYLISLTGGKDSRTALAALMTNGISPYGITYGNPLSRDAVFARLLAEKAGIKHHIIQSEKTTEWFEKITNEIINTGNPLINIHRGHRFYAFQETKRLIGNNTAYYAGYMGGELLMGIYYDDLIFTDFLTKNWENNISFKCIPNILENHFVKSECIDKVEIENQLSELNSLNPSLNKSQKQFHGLFEIGILHHSQDLQLSRLFFNYPIPFFLDIDFLNYLFQTRYSLFFRDNKTKNLLKRYKLYAFNLNIQHLLYPSFDSLPFAKKGSYNTSEFLKGPLYWSLIKSYRYIKERKKYPPSFTYNEEYKIFLKKWLNEILLDKNSDINVIYNVKKAAESLSASANLSSEKSIYRYSNIVMHYLQLKNLQQ